jgi:hypothetical protein
MSLFNRFTEIPPIIKKSPRYRELIDEKNPSLIPIQKKYYFKDFDHLFTNTFEQILNILIYWHINPLPYEVLDYFIKRKDQLVNVDKKLMNYFYELSVINNTEKEELCSQAAYIGSLTLLRAARENNYSWDESVCTRAAVNGNLDCLKYADQNGCPMDCYIYIDTLKSGHRDCFKYVANKCGLKHELDTMYKVVEYN